MGLRQGSVGVGQDPVGFPKASCARRTDLKRPHFVQRPWWILEILAILGALRQFMFLQATVRKVGKPKSMFAVEQPSILA